VNKIIISFLEWINSLSQIEALFFGMSIATILLLVYKYGELRGKLKIQG